MALGEGGKPGDKSLLFLNFKDDFFFLITYIYASADLQLQGGLRVWVQMPMEGGVISLQLESQVVVSYATSMLGLKLGSSARTVADLTTGPSL